MILRANTITKTVSCLLACISTLGLGHKTASAQQEITKRFDFAIKPIKQQIFIAEPLRLNVHFEYLGQDAFQGDLTYQARIGVSIRQPSGEVSAGDLASFYFSIGGDYVPPGVGWTYQPGFKASSEEVLLYYGDPFGQQHLGFVFPKPGVYDVSLNTTLWEGKDLQSYRSISLGSNTVQITVKDVPPEERKPLARWQKEEHAKSFLTGSMQDTTKAELQKLVESYPRSLYASYALFTLAGGIQAPIPPHLEAIPLYEQIAKGPKDFQFMDQVLFSLIEYYSKQRQFDKARALLPILRQWPYRTRLYQERISEVALLEDRRLDQQVIYEFPSTPLQEALDTISRQTGITLKVPERMAKRNISTLRITETMREFMQSISVSKAQWIRDGNGYKLELKDNP